MKYRKIEILDVAISEIGFGAWGIGGAAGGHKGYGLTDDNESLAALNQALESGVNFYDTSDLYGMGHSEELIGTAFHSNRNKVIIATKGGMKGSAGDQDFSSDFLRKSLENSLRRLKTDFVDLYQLHSPPVGLLESDSNLIPFLESIVKEGKARAIGLSALSPAEAMIGIERFKFAAIQVNLNLLDWRAIDNGLLKRCSELGVAVIARTPLCFGFLTGRYSAENVNDPSDHRSYWSKEQIKCWSEAAKLFGNSIQTGGEQTSGQKAIRFPLSFPEITSVIPGMLTPDHVLENTHASVLGPLAESEMEKVEKIYRDNVFFIRKNK